MGQTLAVITLITIPVIIIYALFSKQIVEGVTSTGSKAVSYTHLPWNPFVPLMHL